jgi:NAD(P)-dependent dehydrogenase (short-subunit alcohol dehydrogenase family)
MATREELEACMRVLRAIVEDRTLLASLDRQTRRELLTLAGRASRPERAELRNLAKAHRKRDAARRRQEDASRLSKTGIRRRRSEPRFQTPPPLELPPPGRATEELREPGNCYVCKERYRTVHHFYHQMCPTCGDFNFEKRNQSADLSGRVALITGARVKIGYQAAIKLLRAGATVIVSTRFPRDAATRFAGEHDFESWRDRLVVYGLDLRHTPSVEAFAEHLVRTQPRLDFVVNNACQTVRRPPDYYAHLAEIEHRPLAALGRRERSILAEGRGLLASPEGAAEPGRLAARRSEPVEAIFPSDRLDADLQQVDLRAMNSWRLTLAEVATIELLEVHLVNAVAPFVLNARLKPLMLRQRTFDKHIVNVSAMEGQFYRTFKTDRHPHTNMAKAALNMMTRTSAPDYAKDGIYMNSVDTGWVTDEDPAAIIARKSAEQGFEFSPPLDVVDGAARILAPIFDGFHTGTHVYGQFFKDYAPTAW